MKIIRLAKSGITETLSNLDAYNYFIRLVSAARQPNSRVDLDWRETNNRWTQISSTDKWEYVLLGYVAVGGTYTPNYVYVLKMTTLISKEYNRYKDLTIELSFAGKIIATWYASGDSLIKSKDFRIFLNQKTGVKKIIMIHEQMEEDDKNRKIQESKEDARRKSIGNTLNKSIRLTLRSSEQGEARAFNVIVRPKEEGGYWIGYDINFLESGTHEPFKIYKDKNPDGTELNRQQASDIFDAFVLQLKGSRFVDETSFDYIPEKINGQRISKLNWDFAWNKPIKPVSLETVAQFKGMMKKAQNFNYEGFFSGDVPDYATSYLGTSGVEASQIKSMFSRAGDAIDLVNQFDSSLLLNISFIFNFGKGGAYGVYLSELDRAIKTKALKKKLEQKGYQIETTNKGLTAFPKEGQKITNEQIQQDIDSIYQDLQSKGGTAIGVNMNAVLNASKSDASQSGSKDSGIWEWMAVLHLGGTIVHEAVHAKGHRAEAGPETSENTFIQWALPKINEKYKQSLVSMGKEEEYSPLIITPTKRHAASKSWYKQAQMSYYIPQVYQSSPLGSDLKGRFPYDPKSDRGMAEWSQIAQYYQNMAIEARLGRQFMSPLPKGLDQENDSIEEQLRKYTREDQKTDSHATTEELLSEGHDKNRGYLTLESLLDEKRPHPLIVPLQKSASRITKIATLFGWMNNLDLDDGSTIPGLSDRVMAWDDRDEDFSQEEMWIRNQPRYNPEYDIKGFYYRWIEPRFRPQLFDDMTQEYSNTHPAKRFAGCGDDLIHGDWARILAVLSKVKRCVLSKGLSTRFIISEDIMPLIDYLFRNDKIKLHVFEIKNSPEEEKLYSVWVTHSDIDEGKIERAEKHIQKVEVSEEVNDILDELFGKGVAKDYLFEKIVKQVKAICEEYNFQDVRLSENNKDPRYIYFKGGWGNHCFIVGEILAEKLKIDDVKTDSKNMSLAFNYNGIMLVFKNEL